MAGHQHHFNFFITQFSFPEQIEYLVSGFELVIALDSFIRHYFRNRDRSREVIGMGGTEVGNRPDRLRPCHRISRMRMAHAPDRGEVLIKQCMCFGI
ncbi:hypothetical protein D3C86_2018200 [compost metagenome]